MARRETAVGPGSRALVVDLVRSAGQISRVELTQATGLTQPAISIIVRKLLADGVIIEVGNSASTGGKPRSLLSINARARLGIGIHLGVDSAVFVASDSTGGLFGRQRFRGANGDAPADVVQRIGESYRQFTVDLAIDDSTVAGVAIVVPGPIGLDQRMMGPPAMRNWVDFPLRAALAERIPHSVLVDNDAAAAALGEYWSRQVARTSAFGCIYMGGGIGAGVVIDGSLVRGSSSNAAEVGHISIDRRGRECFCGNVGCVERYAAPMVVVAAARSRSSEMTAIDLVGDVERVFDRIARAAVQGHAIAVELIEESASAVAEGALTLANMSDIDELVLAGWAFAVAGPMYARAITRTLRERAFARRVHEVRVELSSNPRDSAAVGAAALIMQGSLTPGHGPQVA